MAENIDTIKLQRNLKALVEFSRVVNSSYDLSFTLNNLLFSCMGKFLATKGFVALFEGDSVKIAASKGLNEKAILSLPTIKVVDEDIHKPEFEYFLSENGLVLIEKINSSRRCLGFLVLGEKINKQPYSDDETEFIRTILNIAATAIDNSLFIDELKTTNRDLDTRITKLSSLFELSKEFGLLNDESRISKLLAYSLLGQFLVSTYAIVALEENQFHILESTVSKTLLNQELKDDSFKNLTTIFKKTDLQKKYPGIDALRFEIMIPMRLQNETKGIILLGKRINNLDYSKTDIEFINSIGSIAIVSLENKRLFKEALEKQKLEEELELAKDIQKNLLPKAIPQFNNFDICGSSVSSKQVGGDYFDIIKTSENNSYVAIADVSGKGVPASLLMANLQAFLKSICTQNITIEKATAIINDLVTENTSDGKFITFFWSIIDDINKRIKYVNAGHNPPILIRNGEIRYLDKGGMLLGVMKTLMPYESEELDLVSGDVLVLFTDGVTEAKNIADDEFSDEKLEGILLATCHLSSIEIMENIKKEVELYAKGVAQSDDITLIVIKVK